MMCDPKLTNGVEPAFFAIQHFVKYILGVSGQCSPAIYPYVNK